MIIQRIIAPGSKLAFHRALAADTATSSLAQSVGLTDVAEREVYAALDWLIEQQPRIEAALARKHLVDGTLVLYDVSSSYMEGRRCPLARYGHSRDHRADRPQIVYGLLCATDGTPVAIEVFEGDTADPQTIREQVDKLRRRFRLSHVAIVGDRGMVTSGMRGNLLSAERRQPRARREPPPVLQTCAVPGRTRRPEAQAAATSSRSARSQFSIGSAPTPSRCSS